MKPLRIGLLTYLNTLPLALGLELGEIPCSFDLVRGEPAELNAALLEKRVDLTLMSSAAYLRLGQEAKLISSPLGIACMGKVGSVTFHVKGDLRSLNGEEVAVMAESATAASLLELLCRRLWCISPRFIKVASVEEASRYPGFLLIGDRALFHPSFPGYSSIDLSLAWTEMTALPMTFAVVAVRREVWEGRQSEVVLAQAALMQSLEWSESNSERVLSEASSRWALPPLSIANYLRRLTYRLGPKELRALTLFSEFSNAN